MARIRELMALGIAAPVARALGHNLIAQFAAAGKDQASATPLPTNFAILTNTGPTTQGVRIGEATGAALSIYYNAGPNQLLFYPDEGDAFQDLQADVALPIYRNETVILVPSGDSWLVMAATPPGVTQGPGGTSGQIQVNNGGNFGGITISGDATISGTGLATVQGLQGRAVTAALPLDKQVLEWSQLTQSWGPGNVPVGPQGPPGPPAGAYIGPAPPPSPTQGEFWWNSIQGQLYISYDDGNSQQFVVSNIGVPGPPGPSGTAAATVASAPPAGLAPGDLYWNNTTGQLYILYDDGNSRQFVVANTFPGPAYLPLAGGSLSGPLVIDTNAAALPAGPAGQMSLLQLGALDGQATGIVIDTFGTSVGPNLSFRSANGTAAAMAAVPSGYVLGSLEFFGRGATSYSAARSLIAVTAVENWTDAAQGTQLTIATTAPGTTVNAMRVRIGQGVIIGNPGIDPGAGALVIKQNTAAAAPPPLAGRNVQIRVIGVDTGSPALEIDSYGAVGEGSVLSMTNARGSAAAPSANQLGDYLGIIEGYGYGPSGYVAGNRITMQAAETWTATAHGSSMVLSTIPVGTTGIVGILALQRGVQIYGSGGAPPAGGDLGPGTINAAGEIQAGSSIFSGGSLAGGGGEFNGANGSIGFQLGSPSGGSYLFYNQAGGAVETIDSSGNLTIAGATATKPGGGSWSAPSDPRLKEEVKSYDRGLAAILSLHPVSYQYNGGAGTPKGAQFVGLLADEAAAAMPELVSTRRDKLSEDDDSETDIQMLDPSALTYALINAVRELSAKVDEALEKKGS